MNNSIRQISQVFVGSAIALTTFSIQPVTTASSYNQIFIFGDSLVDPGNLFNLTGGLGIPSGFDGGRFSNGPVWSEYFAEALGLEPELWIKRDLDGQLQFIPDIPSDGINFAIAGANTNHTHIGGIVPIGLRQQVDYFTQSLLGGERLNNPQALGVLTAGPNDYIGGELNPKIPVGNLSTGIDDLLKAGLKNILVGNLPDLGQTPLGKTPVELTLEDGTVVSFDRSGILTELTIAHNNLLEKSLKNLSRLNPDANLILFDFYSSFNNILGNLDEFGFINDSCTNIDLIITQNLEPDPLFREGCSNDLNDLNDLNIQNQFLFFDNQHPNTEAHRLIAAEALRTVSTPEPTIIPALGFLGMGLLAFKGRPKKKEEKMVVAK